MSYALSIIGGFVVLVAAVSAGAEPLSDAMREGLSNQKQIYIATQRDDGSRSAAVPIWFWWDGQELFFTTSPDSHKARRIRRGSPVFVSLDGEDGTFVQGTPEVLTDPDVVTKMGDAYDEKYWISWIGFFRPRAQRVADGKTLAVKVVFPSE